MCGIAGIHIKQRYIGDESIPVERFVDALLYGIETRGRDATGFVATSAEAKKVQLQKEPMNATDFIKVRKELPNNLRTVLLHTRAFTQGSPEFNQNNHPVVYRSCIAIHNGVIWNDHTLFTQLGVDRPAEVDSIIIPALIAEKGGMDNAGESLKKLSGSYAIAAIDPIENPDELLLARGRSSPLVYLNTPKFIIWASTETALKNAWGWVYGTPPKKFHHMQEGVLMRANAEDKVEMMEYDKPTYFRSPRRDYFLPHATDTHTHTPYTPASKMHCFECGKGNAYQVITDSNALNNNEWDVPVCWNCYTNLGGDPDNLTYRYADKQLDMRSKGETDMCDFCAYYPVAIWVDGRGKCRGCLEWEARVPYKPKDELANLRPGDLIPENLQLKYEACELCNEGKPVYISEDGFPICGRCRYDEINRMPLDVKIPCRLCRILTNKYTMTREGAVCDSCANEGAEGEPTTPDEGGFDIICESCSEATDPADIEEFGFGQQVCTSCLTEDVDTEPMFEPEEAPEAEEETAEVVELNPLTPYFRESAFTVKVHLRACVETGWELNVPPSFIDWLINHAPKKHLKDKPLKEMHDDAMKAYRENLWLVEELVKNGRDDLLDSIPINEDEAWEVIF